jgi:alcohol dehydrogenase (cytochrome c)
MAWLWQHQSQDVTTGLARLPTAFSATPLVVDGILYTVSPPNDVVAMDAATGRVVWTHPYAPKRRVPSYVTNRGLAILGDTLFMGTRDARLRAINATNGDLVWDAPVADPADPTCGQEMCYSITLAPIVVKNKVIVGVAGGEGRVRGFIAAFDVTTGKEVWRFHTVPGPGERGNQTWSGDSWRTGGGAVWNSGTYDPDLNLTYWGTGNPAPNDNPAGRLGDNLYTDSVVALDADTGQLKWHYQFTPHDDRDWDAAQVPVLADIQWQGRPRKALLQATKNGFWYVLDRSTGQLLTGKPFVDVNWTTGLDQTGRPVRATVTPGTPVLPIEATNWYPPSYSPTSRLFYIPAREFGAPPGYSAVRAFDPTTGERRWEFKRADAVFSSGTLTTASGILFTGVAGFGPTAKLVNGDFYALDADTGQLLWQRVLPRNVTSGPISYSVGGRQYVAVAAGNTLFAFALRQ